MTRLTSHNLYQHVLNKTRTAASFYAPFIREDCVLFLTRLMCPVKCSVGQENCLLLSAKVYRFWNRI